MMEQKYLEQIAQELAYAAAHNPTNWPVPAGLSDAVTGEPTIRQVFDSFKALPPDDKLRCKYNLAVLEVGYARLPGAYGICWNTSMAGLKRLLHPCKRK